MAASFTDGHLAWWWLKYRDFKKDDPRRTWSTKIEEERARASGRYRGLSQRKIQFYKNIGLVMRNSRWVSTVACKNLKRAERGGRLSFSADTLGTPLRPTPPSLPSLKEKSTSPRSRAVRFVLSRFHLWKLLLLLLLRVCIVSFFDLSLQRGILWS